jgi:uncharacterized protein YecT (DUF1311 family)
MKTQWLAALGLLVAQVSPAAAIDCAKASQPTEKIICSTPELKKADDEVSAAYARLLRETTDPDFHAELIRSQQRWLAARLPGPSGILSEFQIQALDPKEDRELLLAWTLNRLGFLQSGEPIRALEGQRRIAAQRSGGPFDGYSDSCGYWPLQFSKGYRCVITVYRQHRDRICSVAQAWAAGGTTDYRLVSVVKNDKPEEIAGCAIGAAAGTENAPCPDRDQTDALKHAPHWKTDMSWGYEMYQLSVKPKDLWKYDPDLTPAQYEQPWMTECLFAPVFPPAELRQP